MKYVIFPFLVIGELWKNRKRIHEVGFIYFFWENSGAVRARRREMSFQRNAFKSKTKVDRRFWRDLARANRTDVSTESTPQKEE